MATWAMWTIGGIGVLDAIALVALPPDAGVVYAFLSLIPFLCVLIMGLEP